MNDHNRENLALQREIGRLSAKLKVRDEIIRLRDERINELEAEIVRKDDQMRELQHQLAAAQAQITDMAKPIITTRVNYD